ncbi:nuclear transport factor 2 family protein [Croceibacterium sp. LX-88]|uniref:Nuclear transport factor 2 family protein n=1 Tax=Croceibacterium selenioxidans TaxID=2838833 RepID=A0ABS5W5C5_9SPHN|nr:nuclear transport factor 2 family protein [Croceibacterium selenioxidans]MBT2134503.1 nuclear transport factor 2 family protein [Croceibacterium selenioxidans]
MSAEPGSPSWFAAYLAAFNSADFDGFGAFYDDRVEFLGRAFQAVGKDAVLEFYRKVRARLDERVELLSFVGSPTICAAEISTTLRAHEDWPDFPTGPLLAGVVRHSTAFVFYDIAGGRFTRIRSCRVQ